MPKIKVVYDGSDISDTISNNGGSKVDLEVSHSLASESLAVDNVDIEAIGSYAADGSVRLYDTNSLALDDVNSAELYASDGTPYYHSLEFKSQRPIDITYDNAFIGRYYARQLKINNKRDVTLTAYSAVWLLKLIPKKAMFCKEKTVADALEEIIGDNSLEQSIKYYVDDDIGSQELNGLIEEGTAYSQIYEILLATGAQCYTEQYTYTDTSGNEVKSARLRFRYPSDIAESTIGASRLVIGSSIENKSPATYLSVTYYDYIQRGTVEQIWQGALTTKQTIYFDEPHVNYSVSGGTLVDSDYMWCKVTGTGSTVTISADELVEISGTTTRGTTPTGIDTDSTKSISGHKLINSENFFSVADRLWSYYQVAQSFKGNIICNNEHAGDVINLYRPDTKETITATIYKMRYQFGNSECRATIEALLNFVPASKDMSGFTNCKILTPTTQAEDGGKFTVPSTATDIYIVMVSGGKGGTSGYDGESTEEKKYYGDTGYQHLRAQSGGEGGECGAGASGGKIYYTVISNVAGQTFSYSCGAGGAGGTEAGGEGSEGAKTTFGNYTTENGKVFAGGYTRKLPDNTYITLGATNADNGIAGSKGSTGGTFDVELYDTQYADMSNGQHLVEYQKYRVNFASGDFGASAFEHKDGYWTVYGITDYGSGYTPFYKSDECMECAIAAGGGKGGACADGDGASGGNASASITFSDGYSFNATSGIGGVGASPNAREQASGYGQGGAGGHGGGGCGGCGEAECECDLYEGEDYRYLVTTQPASSGGSFGVGGQGGNGAILVLYN